MMCASFFCAVFARRSRAHVLIIFLPMFPFAMNLSHDLARTGDLLCFWRWMLLVCRLFTHDSHDLKADVPNLLSKQMLHCFSIDANNFTRRNNTQCFHVFHSQARMPLFPSKVPKKQQLLRTFRTSKTDKQTHTGHKRASTLTKTRGLGCFLLWDGCGSTKYSPNGKNKQICCC